MAPGQPPVLFANGILGFTCEAARRIPRARFRITTSDLASSNNTGEMMTVTHGRSRYTRGCRCNDCITAERDYQRNRYRRRRGLPLDPPDHPPLKVVSSEGLREAGPVESAVQAELHTLDAASDRPGLAQAALALARILDNPKAINQQPAAAKVLAGLLGELRKGSAQRRRGNLALVKSMTTSSPLA